jgi:two-component system nitrogen regulation sensor histidine kinase NtrY
MTIGQRLLVATFALTLVTTFALALGVRAVWRNTEEDRFSAQFESAVSRLEDELEDEVKSLPLLLSPLCEHDPVLDSAAVDLRSGELDAGRRLALSLRVPELMKAIRLDELLLVTGRGEVLGAGHASGLVGTRDEAVAKKLKADPRQATIRTEGGPRALAIEAHCTKTNGNVTLGLYGVRRLESVLARVGASQGLDLSLTEPKDPSLLMVGSARLPKLPGTPIVATRSRLPLHEALGRLDRAVLVLFAATFSAAIALAYFVSRGLSRPIIRLSEQARRVVTGEPIAVVGGGGRELEELARSFNRTIADLVDLRKRLASTERIAARREIARRVAHEIKNPLAPIRAAVETLRRLHARKDPAFEEYFDEASRTVLGEVSRIARIVEEFTQFGRLPPPTPVDVDVHALVREVVNLHASASPFVELAPGPGGKSGPPVPHITADRDQLVQVVTNLLTNAVEAVRDRPSPRVTVELASVDDRRVRVRVRDNGPGVPEAMRGRLFEPYATTKEQGTGLGLAIALQIAVEHGGDLTYADASGGGAEFTLVLPMSGPALVPEAPLPPSQRHRTA